MYASQSLFIITNPYIYYFLLCVCMHLTKNNVYKKCVSNIWPRFFYLQLKKTLVKSNLPFGILRHARYPLDRFRRMPTTNVMTDPLVLITIWPFGKITNVPQILKKKHSFPQKKIYFSKIKFNKNASTKNNLFYYPIYLYVRKLTAF